MEVAASARSDIAAAAVAALLAVLTHLMEVRCGCPAKRFCLYTRCVHMNAAEPQSQDRRAGTESQALFLQGSLQGGQYQHSAELKAAHNAIVGSIDSLGRALRRPGIIDCVNGLYSKADHPHTVGLLCMLLLSHVEGTPAEAATLQQLQPGVTACLRCEGLSIPRSTAVLMRHCVTIGRCGRCGSPAVGHARMRSR